MPLFVNTAEGHSSGTTLSTVNSGGGSGDAFDSFFNSGTATTIYSNAQAAHGSLSYYITCASGTDGSTMIFNNGVNDTSAAIRVYVYFNSLPAANIDLLHLRNSGGAVCKAQINASGQLLVLNGPGSTIHTSSTSMSTSTWYRVELQAIVGASTSTGTINGAYYVGDSTTPTDSYSSSTVNSGTTNITEARFGKINLAGGSFDGYLDDLALASGQSAPIGPASLVIPIAWLSN